MEGEVNGALRLSEAQVPFSIAHQKVELDVNFAGHFKGRTEVTVYPNGKDVKSLQLNARQLRLTQVTVNGFPCSWIHDDPYERLALHGKAGVCQYHILSQNISKAVEVPPVKELTITLPKQVQIQELHMAEVHAQGTGIIKLPNGNTNQTEVAQSTQVLGDASVAKYTILTVVIHYASKEVRDGLQFIRGGPGSGRWPHVYTRTKFGPGSASCLFPCLDALNDRYLWEISIRCPKTVGDAVRQSTLCPIFSKKQNVNSDSGYSGQDALEMIVLCSGDKTDDVVDRANPTMKVVSFSTSEPLSSQQIGFVIGPFEVVKLSDLREARDDESLGQNAVDMYGYCLPGRRAEMKNTCLPTPMAMDFISTKYFACPFHSYAMCFVDDLVRPTSIFAGLTLCSTKLLYPEDVIDPAQEVTRSLVHAIAFQWVGISIIPAEPEDTWITVGISHFLTDAFMKDLCGNNEYRAHMKERLDRVCELDIERPSLYDMGALLHIDPSEDEFMALKAPLVLFILDRKINSVAGRSKMPGIIAKILTRARIGELPDNFLSTDIFQKQTENFFHAKIDDFINQWVRGAGYPIFNVIQRFNKKKLVVELSIEQVQGTLAVDKDLEVNSFIRDVREDFNMVYAAGAQHVFTGPITIRIHEADGTPYEHVVEIKQAKHLFDIPYNTKYKRLKRSKRQKTKHNANASGDGGEGEGEALLYCLGDVLQTEEEVFKWRLTEWSTEDEERMNAESYEWIRLDTNFEWICRKTSRGYMPGYMYVSQLQQDRDVVAQIESVKHMDTYPPNPLVSSFLLRTVMDRRYFHGVRTLAARGLAKHAVQGDFHLRKAFEELFCLPEHDSRMARPNDFSDLPSYYLQCAIVEGISKVRDENGFAPKTVKDFLLDKLRFNDNSVNDFSDAHYVAKLMRALCSAVAARPRSQAEHSLAEEDAAAEQHATIRLEQDCLAEIDRYRRMDEWTDSYQNLYSRTALECQHLLAKSNIGTLNPMHFLQYTRPGNYDMLRAEAYKVLTQSNMFDNPSILRYILHSRIADPNPWLREAIGRAFGEALASKAIGSGVHVEVLNQDDLTIEDPAAIESRKSQIARRQTIEGATTALSTELGSNEALKIALWNAICLPTIGLEDLQDLLDICRLLYEPFDSLVVQVDYPRYWKVDIVARGKLRFRKTDKVRIKAAPKWQPPVKSAAINPDSSTPISTGSAIPKIKLRAPGKGSASATPEPPLPATVYNTLPPAIAAPTKLKIKFSRPKEES